MYLPLRGIQAQSMATERFKRLGGLDAWLKTAAAAVFLELLLGCGARVDDSGPTLNGVIQSASGGWVNVAGTASSAGNSGYGGAVGSGGWANVGGATSYAGNTSCVGVRSSTGGDPSSSISDAAVSLCQCAGTMPRSDTSNSDCVCSPSCTIENYCALAPPSDPCGGCSAGPINGYYILTCSETDFQYGYISSSYFCQHDWSSLRAACSLGAASLRLVENCGGFNIAFVGGMHISNRFYYDLNSGKLVGTMAATGLESLNFFNCAGAQLPTGFGNSVSDCKPVDCGADAGI